MTPSLSGYIFNPTSLAVIISRDDATGKNFTASQQSFTLTYTAGANGSISGTTPQTVNYGASGTAVTAVPNTGYHFVNWTGGVTSTGNPLTVTNVTSNMTITANFAVSTCTVIFVEGDGGTISGTRVQSVSYGTAGTAVTAVPKTGYHFTGWSGSYTGTTNPLTIPNVTADMTITANFISETADNDNDDLSDWWETQHFGNLDYGKDDDPDSDGLSNYVEYKLGLDPGLKALEDSEGTLEFSLYSPEF